LTQCDNDDEISITNKALLVPFLFYFSHRNMIALKYGSLTKEEYHRYMSCKDDEISKCYADQIHVLSIWINIRSDLIINW
jgi:hypothetical protein